MQRKDSKLCKHVYGVVPWLCEASKFLHCPHMHCAIWGKPDFCPGKHEPISIYAGCLYFFSCIAGRLSLSLHQQKFLGHNLLSRYKHTPDAHNTQTDGHPNTH